MKKSYYHLLTILVLLFCINLDAQTAQKNFINYQGVARDSENNLMEEEAITVGIALKFGSTNATAVYEETHSVSTDANGVFSLKIGDGNAISGSYGSLPWGGAAFMMVALNGTEIGTTELTAVPYAIASGDKQWTENGLDIENKNEGEVNIKNNLMVNGGFNLSNGNQVNEISDDGELAENSNGILPTQRAVKTYVDTRFFAGGGIEQNAAEVPYNNTTSGLAATDAQAAIDELVAVGVGTDGDTDTTNEFQNLSLSGTNLQISDGTGVDLAGIITFGGTDDQNAAEVPFDNSISGLVATDAQAAIDELATSGLVDADDQDLSLSGTTLQITNGTGVDLAGIIPPGGTDDQNAAEVPFDNTASGLVATDAQAAIDEMATSGLVDTDDQGLVLTGDVLSIEDGIGSVDLSTYRDDADADPVNEIQTISFDAVTNEISLTDGGTITIPEGSGSGIALPYYDEVSESGAAFHVQNDESGSRYGLAGSTGVGAETLPPNRAGVLGTGNEAHGVYGYSLTNFYAGVQGVSNSSTGVGVQGFGFGGGVGGHFYTTSSGVAALTTGRGNVGIGTGEPEEKLHVAGNMLVQSNLGSFRIGLPDNGNQWRLSTINSGSHLQFGSKPNGSGTFTTRFRMRRGGEFQIGDMSNTSAWAHVRKNSTVSKPHLKLEEVGNDYARLELTNSTSNSFWHVAGLARNSAANSRLNFFFSNNNSSNNRMMLTGDGKLGINGVPQARLHIYQRGQGANDGLRFSDGTVNLDWDILHSFALQFRYGGVLKAAINPNTGAYTQVSDRRLKTNIADLAPVLDRVSQLRPATYRYIADVDKKATIGLIAQEVQPLFPELVAISGNDEMLALDYGSFSVVAIKAIQEQQKIINGQSRKISALEERLQRLEARFSK